MQGEGADEGEAVDVAEVDFAAEEEEGGEEEAEEEGAGEVGVVHYVLGYGAEGVEDCECLRGGEWLAECSIDINWAFQALGFAQAFDYTEENMDMVRTRRFPPRLCSASALINRRRRTALTYLPLNMSKIHPQLLQQRRFPIITLRPKCSQPSRPQTSLLSHSPTHPWSCTKSIPSTGSSTAHATRDARVGLAACRWLAIAILSLGGSAVAGDWLAVAGWVELEVGRVVGLLLLLGVVLGHDG